MTNNKYNRLMTSSLLNKKKITLTSDYNFLDIFSTKTSQQCSIRIPQTILLQKGTIKDWIFNSHKIINHPILKKKKQNMTPIIAIKTLCYINGYGKYIQKSTYIKEIVSILQQIIQSKKDYQFVKNKKVIIIVTTDNQIIQMNLLEFLKSVSENKNPEQYFSEHWKIIQQKISHSKSYEHYRVTNLRYNHIIQSRCQKIVKTKATRSTQLNPTQLSQQPAPHIKKPNLQGFKFYDTFLNNQFFNLSQNLINYIQKNYKCLVQSIIPLFVINKQRQPFLIAIDTLQIKPIKKIVDIKYLQLSNQELSIKIEQYLKCLKIYLNDTQHPSKSHPSTLTYFRPQCKGKMCSISLQSQSPSLQHNLKIPSLSTHSRHISTELRDAVLKRKRKVFDKLQQKHLILQPYQQQSSQYQSSSDNNQFPHHHSKKLNQSLKICQNCYLFYFYVNHFFELDIFGNLIQKKPIKQYKQHHGRKSYSEKVLNHQYVIKRWNKQNKQSNLTKKQSQQQQEQSQCDKQYQIHNKTVQIKQTPSHQRKRPSTVNHPTHKKNQHHSIHPIQKHTIKTQINLNKPSTSTSKSRLNQLVLRKNITENSQINHLNYHNNHKRILLKLSQQMQMNNFNLKNKSRRTSHSRQFTQQKKPQNYQAAQSQLLTKFRDLHHLNRDLFIVQAKKYYQDNLPKPFDQFCFSNSYDLDLYEFMNASPISIHPKRKIKQPPTMSLLRLSELTECPQLLSGNGLILDTLIISNKTTIPFCIIPPAKINVVNINQQHHFQNIFIIQDIFDCFLQYIPFVKSILGNQQIANKRFILLNLPGQSHTLYDNDLIGGYISCFSQILDKLLYRLSEEENQLNLINLQKDYFKFFGIGCGGFLLAHYLSNYALTFQNRLKHVTLVNSFMEIPYKYKSALQSLLQLYLSKDPIDSIQCYKYYNEAISSPAISNQQMKQKSEVNPIKLQDRIYLLKSLLPQFQNSPISFNKLQNIPISVVYSKNNPIIPKEHCLQFLQQNEKHKKQTKSNFFYDIQASYDIFSDNYSGIYKIFVFQCSK